MEESGTISKALTTKKEIRENLKEPSTSQREYLRKVDFEGDDPPQAWDSDFGGG